MNYYQVDIDEIPSERISFVRALRVIGKMSLKNANDVVTHLSLSRGGTVIAGVKEEVARHVAQELDRAGARTSVSESSVRFPLSCKPIAAKKFVWSKFRSLESA